MGKDSKEGERERGREGEREGGRGKVRGREGERERERAGGEEGKVEGGGGESDTERGGGRGRGGGVSVLWALGGNLCLAFEGWGSYNHPFVTSLKR